MFSPMFAVRSTGASEKTGPAEEEEEGEEGRRGSQVYSVDLGKCVSEM